MFYLVQTRNDPLKSSDRDRVRPDHLAYLNDNMGILLSAGATLDDAGLVPTGSFYILEVGNREEAEAFMATEPYCLAGIAGTVTFTRWRKAIFDFARQIPSSP